MKFVLPLILALLGTGAGVGAAFVLSPPSDEAAEIAIDCPAPEPGADIHAEALPASLPADQVEYVKMNKQFVIPVIKEEKVRSLVVMTLSVEVPLGQTELVYNHEPKLRDLFLQIMFDHANAGGFEGGFTNSSRLDSLRQEFRTVARRYLGDSVNDILITEIAKQDI